MKTVKLAMMALVVTSSAFATPPTPEGATFQKESYTCIDSQGNSYHLTYSRPLSKTTFSLPSVSWDYEETLTVGLDDFAYFDAILKNKASGKHEGKAYFTIGYPLSRLNCERTEEQAKEAVPEAEEKSQTVNVSKHLREKYKCIEPSGKTFTINYLRSKKGYQSDYFSINNSKDNYEISLLHIKNMEWIDSIYLNKPDGFRGITGYYNVTSGNTIYACYLEEN